MGFLNAILPYAVVVVILATLGVLVLGVLSMLGGGDFNKKYSNKLMQMRVGFQATALALLALLFLMKASG
ncbi:MAG: twin transmembrane helix small protein [Alphaproteobacteria bacterium]